MSFWLLLSDELMFSKASTMTTRSLFWLIIANEVCHHKCIISPSICITSCFSWLFFYPVIQYCVTFLKQFTINCSLDYSDFFHSKKISSCLSLFTPSSSAFTTDVVACTHGKLWKLLYYSSMSLQKSVLYINVVSFGFASMEVRLSDLYLLGLVSVLKYYHTCRLPFFSYCTLYLGTSGIVIQFWVWAG